MRTETTEKGNNGVSRVSKTRGINTDLVPPIGSHVKKDVVGAFSSQTPRGRRSFVVYENGTTRQVSDQAIEVMTPRSSEQSKAVGTRLPGSSRRNGSGR